MNARVKHQPMKTRIKSPLHLPALIAGLGLILAGRVTAQTLTTLHSFTGNDGAGPPAGLILSANTLYGTASQGGSSGQGTVFKVNIDGSDFTTLHGFTAVSGTYPFNNKDGACPHGGLILSGNTLYGTTAFGGSSGFGTVFKVNTDATGFTNLHDFTNSGDGATPWAGLVISGNTMYGTTSGGGSSGAGTVFALNTNGAGFTTLHSFTATSGSFPGPYTNTDGASPEAGLILSGNTLYGTTYYGGSSANGTVFALNNNGTGFTTLYSFTGRSDGANPVAGSIFSNHTLYGTAYGGATAGNGTVFSLSLGPVSAPQLTIIPSGANVILTWPTNATTFTLAPEGMMVSWGAL